MWSCGVDEKETDVKHLTSLTGVLTSDITINQNCIFKYWFFKGKKNSERGSLSFVNTNINICSTERNALLWFSPLQVRDDWVIFSQKNIMIDDWQCLMFCITGSRNFMFWLVSLYIVTTTSHWVSHMFFEICIILSRFIHELDLPNELLLFLKDCPFQHKIFLIYKS